MPWTTKLSLGGGGRESVGEAREKHFLFLHMHSKKLVTFQKKIVDFSQKSSFLLFFFFTNS